MGMEPLRPQSNQEAGDFVKQMAGVFKKTKAALEWTTEGMKRYYNWGQQPDNLKVRDKVWLDTRDIKMDQPSKKLDYKRVGFFKIIKKHRKIVYKLCLPKMYKCHILEIWLSPTPKISSHLRYQLWSCIVTSLMPGKWYPFNSLK